MEWMCSLQCCLDSFLVDIDLTSAGVLWLDMNSTLNDYCELGFIKVYIHTLLLVEKKNVALNLVFLSSELKRMIVSSSWQMSEKYGSVVSDRMVCICG